MIDYSHIHVSLIGFGNVGRSIMHLLLQDKSRQYSINIMDPSEEIAGSKLDLGPASFLEKRHDIHWGDKQQLRNANFIFYSAGVAVPKGECRDYKLQDNRDIVNRVFKDLSFTQSPSIITLTNPLDAIALDILNATELPSENVIGIGTIIESVRFEYYLQQKMRTGNQKIEALVIGEHGETMVPVLSRTIINGTPIKNVLTKDQIHDIIYDVRTTPHQIKETQPASHYAAATAAVNVFEALLSHSSKVIPLSVYSEREGVFYSQPVQISSSGIRPMMPPLEPDEKESLELSISKIRSMSNSSVAQD